MLDDLGRGRSIVFQHVLNQVDPAAWAVEFVAEQHVSRAGRGTEPAMHTGSENTVRGFDIRVGELRQGEMCLHWVPLNPRDHATWIEHAPWIKAILDPR